MVYRQLYNVIDSRVIFKSKCVLFRNNTAVKNCDNDVMVTVGYLQPCANHSLGNTLAKFLENSGWQWKSVIDIIYYSLFIIRKVALEKLNCI